MNKTLLGLAVLPFVAGNAIAAQPLTDKQMDQVAAGHILVETDTTDTTFIGVSVGGPLFVAPPSSVATTLGDVILPLTTIQVIWGAIP
jgi:hypothetical protein